MVENEIHQLLLIHDGQHLFGEAIHVAIRALHFEGRFGTELIRLPSTLDVQLIHVQYHIAQHGKLLEDVQ